MSCSAAGNHVGNHGIPAGVHPLAIIHSVYSIEWCAGQHLNWLVGRLISVLYIGRHMPPLSLSLTDSLSIVATECAAVGRDDLAKSS